MNRDQAISAALQLQRDIGLIMSNLQVLGQFVTSLNRMSSGHVIGVLARNNTRRRRSSLWREVIKSGDAQERRRLVYPSEKWVLAKRTHLSRRESG